MKHNFIKMLQHLDKWIFNGIMWESFKQYWSKLNFHAFASTCFTPLVSASYNLHLNQCFLNFFWLKTQFWVQNFLVTNLKYWCINFSQKFRFTTFLWNVQVKIINFWLFRKKSPDKPRQNSMSRQILEYPEIWCPQKKI